MKALKIYSHLMTMEKFESFADNMRIWLLSFEEYGGVAIILHVHILICTSSRHYYQKEEGRLLIGRHLVPTQPMSNLLALVTILDTSPAGADAVYSPVWYRKESTRKVVDLVTIQCLVGRICVRDKYSIVDRMYGAEGMEFLGSEEGFKSEDEF